MNDHVIFDKILVQFLANIRFKIKLNFEGRNKEVPVGGLVNLNNKREAEGKP